MTTMTKGSVPTRLTDNVEEKTLSPSSDIHGGATVHFPPKEDDSESQLTFVEACQLAAESHRPLHLSEDITDLSETIVLRKRQHLSIVGKISSPLPCENSKNANLPSSRRIKIAGKIHSLFLLNNHSQLKLRDLELIHQDDDGEDCRNVGAAVNLRYKSKAWLETCSVTSHAGFCCWAVQKASIDLSECSLEAPLRSAVVCFGQAQVEGRSCTISNAGVHGVCARGECHIRFLQSYILDSAVRGLYAYANASVCLDGCTIRGTVRPDMAAIEVLSADVTTTDSLGSNGENGKSGGSKCKANKKKVVIPKSSSLMMKDCHVIDNAGVGVKIRGGVRHNLSSQKNEQNHFAGNLGGDIVICHSTSDEDPTGQKVSGEERDKKDEKQTTGPTGKDDVQKSQSNETLRRDASGSSFRKGDWWCPVCVPESVVHGSKDFCPRCKSMKRDGKLLSSEEVIKLNRGGAWTPSTERTNILGACVTINSPNKMHIEKATDTEGSPTWWFDGDDAGWLPYDTESNQKLESTFQALRCLKLDPPIGAKDEVNEEECKQFSSNKIVLLSEGRYRVNVETMEQVNTESHFLRLVRRRGN